MRYLFLILSLLMLASCQPGEPTGEDTESEPASEAAASDAMDAVEAYPDHYKVELDNEHVRVVRILYEAGEESGMHSHPAGVVVFVSDGTVQMTLADGTVEERSWKAGDALWSPAETHAGKADTAVEAVLIEVKGSGGEVEIPDTNGTVVDPDHHTVEFENEKVRIVRMVYPAGSKTPPHTHLSGVSVALTDAKARNTVEGEEPVEGEGTAGTASWVETGLPHVTENMGEEFSLVRVEIKHSS